MVLGVNRENIVTKKVDDGLIVVSLEDDPKVFLLDDFSLAVWNLIDGKISLDGIFEKLSADYVSEYSRDDLSDIINFLEENKLITICVENGNK